MMWYRIRQQQIELFVLAKPNAKKTRLQAISEDSLHISLHAKAQKGEANKELISYLAELFRIPKSQIVLQRGEVSRHKQLILPLTASVQELIDNPTKFIT